VGTTFVIVNGGTPPHPGAAARLPRAAGVIAADSGLDHAEAMGLTVALVVGDLDSVSAGALERAEAAGVEIERHPVDKDAVDLELALAAAVARGGDHVVVVAGGGDRLDHELAALHALAAPDLADVLVEAWWGTAHVRVLHGPGKTELDGGAGTLVGLVPLHGDAVGVTTTGLRWALCAETLPAGTSRGVSNELRGGPASVAIDRGTLAVIEPDALRGTA
jgi:thiamine pyrophosphokinase